MRKIAVQKKDRIMGMKSGKDMKLKHQNFVKVMPKGKKPRKNHEPQHGN